MNLNAFSISGLLIMATSIPPFIFMFFKGKRLTTQIYALNILMVALWGATSFTVGLIEDRATAILLWKIAYIFVLLLPVFLFHAVVLMTDKKNYFLLKYIYLIVIIFILLNSTDQLFINTKYMFGIHFLVGTKYYGMSFCFWLIVATLAHLQLFLFYKRRFPKERKQINCLILASIGFIGGTTNFLPNFGLPIYPYGNFVVPLYPLIVTYAIYRHQLLDIEIAYKKSVSYSILFAFITLAYLLVVLSSEKLIQHYWQYNSPILSIFTAFIIGIVFIPLRNKIQKILDLLFFNVSHLDIIDENELLRQEVAQTDKLKSIATFASGMAHEVKNPLTSIKTFVEYLPQRHADPEFINKFTPIVNKEIDRINELVHGLLDYAKPTPLNLKPTDIHKLLNDTLDILNSQLVAKKIRAIKEFDTSGTKIIWIDPKQMKQVFLNIFINAIDALPSEGFLRITIESNISKFLITISDSGCGISKDDLPHIFDPFFTKKEKGTGLGLSITHGIIKEHDGKIFVESEVGRGTTFRIEIPLMR